MTSTTPAPLNVLRYALPRGAEQARSRRALAPALLVYLALLVASALFYANKPFDFPERNAAFPAEVQGLGFWLKVMLVWQPPLELMWIVFLVALLEWLREGRLALKLLGGIIATATPFVLMIAYHQNALGRGAYTAFAALCLSGLWPLLRRISQEQWRAIATFMLAINVIGLLALIPMQAAIWIDSQALYKGGQIVGGLWILGTGTMGLRSLTGLKLPRCFMALLLSMFLQIAFAFTLHMLDLVPKQILQALLYA